MEIRKLIAILLGIVMMSLNGAVGFAYDFTRDEAVVLESDTSGENHGKINMVYMGTSSGTAAELANATPTIQDIPDTSEWVADKENGTVFWVGLTISDLKKMDASAGSGGDGITSHFSHYANEEEYDWKGDGGIFNIAAGIEYASEYLAPVYASNSQFATITNRVMRKIDSRYEEYGVDVANQEANIIIHSGREANEISEENKPKLMYVSISSSRGIESKIFGYTDDLNDEELCIMAVPFRLIKMPEKGTKVVQAALNPAHFVIQTGSATSVETLVWQAQWNSDTTITPDQNLKNHFDYTGSLDLFEKIQDTGDAYLNITKVAVNTADGEEITQIPNSDFTTVVTVNATKATNGYIIAAAYDERGVLIDVEYIYAEAIGQADTDFELPIENNGDVENIKVFVWSGFDWLKPLAEVKGL